MSKVNTKEAIDRLMYKSYNLLSNAKFSFSRSKKIVSENSKFENKYATKKCHILATGPSLIDLDVDEIRDGIVFGVNYLYKGSIFNDINVDYYFLYDNIFYSSHVHETVKMIKEMSNTIFFLRVEAKLIFDDMGFEPDNVYYQSCKLFQYDDFLQIDITKNVTAPFNVLLGGIQTALYMGFGEINLYGADFNSFASLKSEHFYDNKGVSHERTISLGDELKFYSLVAYHHYALATYAQDHKVRIVNHNINSLLDAYERI